ncbi:helix-turn-helix transcriptional regulator [Natronorubrum halophilum]|uniref:helix-turn-helix transcriptional regulator n=1 Tax=Natronorubrum halophilum TaxID=1702106 RepID=UPI000EF67F00|nr:hypothetical protein [Natronorubrum halophilum]
MNRSVSVGVVLLVVVVSIAGLGVPMAMTATGGTGPHQSAETTPGTPTQTDAATQLESSQPSNQIDSIAVESQDFDKTTFEITVHENGSATWTFQHEQRFGTDNQTEAEDREAFEEFADEFESEETDLYDRFTESAQSMTDSGADLTGREMEATNFERSTTVEDQFGSRGFVEMSFTWEGFAAVEGNTVTVGDVFQNIYLGPDQAMVIETGDGLRFDRVTPEEDAQYPRESIEDANSVRWSGEQQFLDGNPRVVFVQEGAGDGLGNENPVSAVVNGDDTTWYLGLGAIAVLGIVGSIIWYRRQGGTAGGGGGANAAAVHPDGQEPSAATAAAGVDDRNPDAASESGALTDEELLTDDDRVVKLIRENGGRMKQVKIVEETGWSKSKVSMLLSDMEEDGTISKLRVGRENIISLEGFEPEATKSPFDE